MMNKILLILTIALFIASTTGCRLFRRDEYVAPPAVYSQAPGPACGCQANTIPGANFPANTVPGSITYEQ